ncbi:unnamed protein product [Symbiodinium sp. CCMP2592]|nr:unnamed protein product [Symbiodinium sp. CCMP2592]
MLEPYLQRCLRSWMKSNMNLMFPWIMQPWRNLQFRSLELFSALLASLTKGRPLSIVRSVSDSNGGEAYRLLVRTLSPTSKSRALALLGAIAQYPSFTTGSLLEQILKFEELHARYRQASGKEVDEQLVSAVLLRSLPPEVKSHVTVNLPEDASYAVLREMLMKWERGTQKWSSSLVSGGNAHSDAMDVDQIGQVKGGDKDAIVDSSSASIHMLQCFTIHDAGDPFLSTPRPEHEAFDLTLDDDRNIGCGNVQVVFESIEDEYSSDSWEQVSHSDQQMYEIALDSGADVSVMPFDWASLGSPEASTVTLELRDAQGGNMPHKGIRCLELDLGDAILKEQFVVTSVRATALRATALLASQFILAQVVLILSSLKASQLILAQVCEFNERLETLESLELPLPEVTAPVEVITIMTKDRASITQLGIEVMLDTPDSPTSMQHETESEFQYSPDALEEPQKLHQECQMMRSCPTLQRTNWRLLLHLYLVLVPT